MRVDQSRKEAQAGAGVHGLGQDEEAICMAGDGGRPIASTMATRSCELDAEVLSLPTAGQFLLQANGTAQRSQQAPRR